MAASLAAVVAPASAPPAAPLGFGERFGCVIAVGGAAEVDDAVAVGGAAVAGGFVGSGGGSITESPARELGAGGCLES